MLRRFLSGPNIDSYRVDKDRLSMIEGSYVPRVRRSEAVAALNRLEARYGN